jgi:putative FmdB family regulatory protein
MPTYEFECVKCNEHSEIFKKINDPHPTICPKCGKDGLVRAYRQAPGVEFKGQNWVKNGGQY